jgi:hypothetical protein
MQDQALTIHDLSPLEHPEWFRPSFTAWYRLFLPILARRVQTVFTPSEYVKRKISAIWIKNVIVTQWWIIPFSSWRKATMSDLSNTTSYLLDRLSR